MRKIAVPAMILLSMSLVIVTYLTLTTADCAASVLCDIPVAPYASVLFVPGTTLIAVSSGIFRRRHKAARQECEQQ